MSDIAFSIYIVGPTASGKSELALSMAREFNGEIINADSMQVYKGLDIGTAKLPHMQRAGIAHHMMDVIDVGEDFSVAEYKSQSMEIMEDISKRGARPIICGGTGLYINALSSKLDFTAVRGDPELRATLSNFAKINGNKALHERLRDVDPTLAERLHENDTKRIIRGIEVFTLTGEPLSGQGKHFRENEDEDYPFVIIGLEWPRDILDGRIYTRVDHMMEQGLYREARAIFSRGIDVSHPSMMALGYRQLYEHFMGKCSLDEAVANIKLETRRYAKRQMTWFKRDLRVKWLNAEQYEDQNALKQAAKDIVSPYI